MKGLLIKDMKLMLGQIMFLIVLPIVGAMIVVPSGQLNMGFGYIASVSGLFAVTTINYDSYDNGYSFLFTLPVSRRGYVRESYLFSILSACVMMIGYCILGRVLGATLHPDNGLVSVFWERVWDLFKVTLLMIALLNPFYLFFGMKRRNQYILIVIGAIVIYIVYTGSMPLYGAIEKGVKLLKEFPVTLVLLMTSYVISVGIMERKDL